MTYIVKINHYRYSYGFELKDEAGPYKKYALVLRITNNIAIESGLKVGDKVVSINGENVAGKDYIGLRNNIRKSIDNCVVLEIIKETDFQLISSDLSPSPINLSPLNLSFGRTLIPSGNIQEKIKLFQTNTKNDSNKTNNRSNSLGNISKFNNLHHCFEKNVKHNIIKTSSISVENIVEYMEPSILSSEININQSIDQKPNKIIKTDINLPISQDPFLKNSLSVFQDNVMISIFEDSVQVEESKVSENIEYKPIKRHLKIDLKRPEFSFNYNTPFNSNELSLGFMNTKSRSSNNLYEESTNEWSIISSNLVKFTEYGSMTDIKSIDKLKEHENKKLPRQQSLLINIPIKLRIHQFHERVKSKGWKDYIIESEPNGARFRKRFLENNKDDRTNNFIIRLEDVNKFEIELPHRRLKNPLGSDFSDHESLLKYNLIAFNGRVHLKFHFNPTIFQDNQSSSNAHEIFNTIITSFKAARKTFSDSINPHSLSQSSSLSLSLYDTQVSNTAIKDLNSSIEVFSTVGCPNSGSSSCKSKSPADNLSYTTFDINCQSSSKNIFKYAIGIIKPEKKIKITQSYQVFAGTKTEFEEFKKQLEGGQLPLEIESNDENGLHFNRFIYEVPRMSSIPRIPMIIYLCTEIVEKIGLKVEGIYRISGNQRIIRTLSNTLNKSLDDIETNLPEWNNVHAVCGTLKLFLRKLKQYLIPADLSHVLAYSCKGVDCDNPKSLSKTLMDIRYHLSSYNVPFRQRSESNTIDQVDCRWQALQYILKHLSKVIDHRQYNNMDGHAVTVCFNPVIMESWQNNFNDIKTDNEIMVKALELIVVHQEWLFNNWHSEMDYNWSTELVHNAESYATNFINTKYSFNIKVDDIENEDVEEININKMVEEIIRKSTTTFIEKEKPRRRHSSHISGEKPNIPRNKIDIPKSDDFQRNSQISEALDLVTYANLMKGFTKVPYKDDGREGKVTSPTKSDDEECYKREFKVLTRQKPLSTNVIDNSH